MVEEVMAMPYLTVDCSLKMLGSVPVRDKLPGIPLRLTTKLFSKPIRSLKPKTCTRSKSASLIQSSREAVVVTSFKLRLCWIVGDPSCRRHHCGPEFILRQNSSTNKPQHPQYHSKSNFHANRSTYRLTQPSAPHPSVSMPISPSALLSPSNRTRDFANLRLLSLSPSHICTCTEGLPYGNFRP